MSLPIKLFRTPILLFILVTVFTSIGVIGLRHLGIFEFLELATYDWTLRLQPSNSTPDSRIVLVTISEQDIRSIGRWPLIDHTVAQLLEQLSQYGTRAIGLDIYRDFDVPPGTEQLNQIFTRNPNIVTVMKFPSRTHMGIPGPRVLINTDQVAFNDILEDSGGTVRRGLLFLDNGEISATSFALALVTRYLHQEGMVLQPDEKNSAFVKLGAVTLPPLKSHDGAYVNLDDSGYQFIIRYRHGNPSFSHYAISDILTGTVPAGVFQNKIVLIGVTAESVKDSFITPYSGGLDHEQSMPGIEVHAQMASQLLRMALESERPIQVLSDWQEQGWIVLWCMIGGLTALVIRALWSFLSIFVAWTVLLVGIAYFAIQFDWWLPLLTPVLGLLVTGSLVSTALSKMERDQRQLLMDLFSKHVSPEVANLIWQQRDQFFHDGRLRTQKQVVTALFADLEGFTPIAESFTPQQLMDWLNQYMELMATVVMKHQGVVDDYYGDAIKANFGVPFVRTTDSEIRQDAQNAVMSALEMKNEIIRLNMDLKAQALPPVRLRIGIFTGPVVAGSLGSSQRLKFTTVGDAVNIAARLESLDHAPQDSLTEEEPCRILIGETTKTYLDGQWETHDCGEIKLKGKEHRIKVYRILGFLEEKMDSR
ncbi:adenylate/guanylate cyclase domain-containing protein [Candidatus Nitronereus thalassa]|uniref:Adenylate/guanylate cyclase domain-containing protein n=1 Tax=Candidatus Nitronereus thalassa TaxID=3020898 RepID=A0ABU3K9F5_9BACT|nr:adenylate/guanylate cyclase domain-containing protein [Candidatus Nitronereus thalassa]MDT7043023.1 adenylate/guanylate cyclase domain-containing protein [Candidatus Nitronereus thalassa]